MAYDEELASRVRRTMRREIDVAEKRMFGGLCFTVSGRMCCGVLGADLVLRVSPERYEAALRAPHVRPMDFTGRPIRGFLYVGPRGARDARALRKWIAEGITFARSLATVGGGRAAPPRSRPSARRTPRSPRP